MKYNIELSIEDINNIVVQDLKDAYNWNLDNEAEHELRKAIEVILSYYMKPDDQWLLSRTEE